LPGFSFDPIVPPPGALVADLHVADFVAEAFMEGVVRANAMPTVITKAIALSVA
jgi:hypothetical protein